MGFDNLRGKRLWGDLGKEGNSGGASRSARGLRVWVEKAAPEKKMEINWGKQLRGTGDRKTCSVEGRWGGYIKNDRVQRRLEVKPQRSTADYLKTANVTGRSKVLWW